MKNIDGNKPLTLKILGEFVLQLFLIGFRRMVLFLVVFPTWGILNATNVGFLQTIAPFVGIALALVVYIVFLRKPQSVVKPPEKTAAESVKL
jgi:hypothetical protein